MVRTRGNTTTNSRKHIVSGVRGTWYIFALEHLDLPPGGKQSSVPINSGESSNFNGNFRYIFQSFVVLLLNDFERSASWLFKTSLFVTIHSDGDSV